MILIYKFTILLTIFKICATPEESVKHLQSLPTTYEDIVLLAEYWIELAHFNEILGNFSQVVQLYEDASNHGAQVTPLTHIFILFITNHLFIISLSFLN